jgi:uncharacterized protein YjbI with pentapeptide repeats
MNPICPAIAVVRPRVSSAHSGDVRLLEEVVAEIADENPQAAVQIIGPAGSGKSTALRHLAAVFELDDRFVFLDEPKSQEVIKYQEVKFVIATARMWWRKQFVQLPLAPWRTDEFVEYLLAKHRNACASVMTRLGAATRRSWSPQISAILLDRFATNEAACDAESELFHHVKEQIPDTTQRAIVSRFCLQQLSPVATELPPLISQIAAAGCPHEMQSLLCHPIIQLPLAAEALLVEIVNGSVDGLKKSLSFDLVESVGHQVAKNKVAAAQLQKVLENRQLHNAHAMAASILHVFGLTWRPEKRDRSPWQLRGAYFPAARWNGADLAKADLSVVNFASADLEGACLVDSLLVQAQFERANLNGADFTNSRATGAGFQAASLRDAKLQNAHFIRADFTDADLSNAALIGADLEEANLTSCCLKKADLTRAKLTQAIFSFTDLFGASLIQANLTSADLRAAQLAGAKFRGAILKHAQLEDVYMPDAMLREANLQGAHLSGSIMPGADFREANLSGAYLAEIDWEGADLRGANLKGATFHMGSSRSGLVGSPIACEGSKTGFYTDDYEDMHFKRPEEVRKGNLRGADLRGANITGIDFYLVDLREARLDPDQLEHARQCRAILEDLVA